MGAMTERDILRRQLHDDIIDSLRKRASPPPPQALLAKVLACYAIGRQKGGGAARAVAERYNNDPILLKALAAPGMIGKAAVLPAQTTVAGWAAELSTSGIADFWQVPAPQSVYAQLSSHPGAIRVSLAGRSSIKLPTRAPTPTLCAPFVGEGAPIPVRQMALSTASLAPKKASCISEFTKEQLKHSTPSIEALIRATMTYDAAVSVDGVLLGATAATAIAPAGLLNGVVATGATAGGGLAAFAGDVRALTLAIEATGPLLAPALLMSSSSKLLLDVLALGGADDVPIIASPTVPARQLILVDAGNFGSAEGDTPSIDASREVTLHEEDTTPQPISTPGAPNVVSAPTRSTFQTATIAVRLLQDLSWIMTRAGRVAYVNSVSW